MTIHRRQFLHNTAAAGTALAAASAAGVARAAASEKIVVGVMGVNGRGNSLARSFAARDDSAVAYVCDVDERAVAKATKTVTNVGAKAPKGVKDFREILNDKTVDVLVIAAPDHWHGPASIAACAAGKHVYVEKPACHNPREGEMMVEAARKHKRVVQLGTQRRSREKIIEGIEFVRDGGIGRAYYSRGWYANTRRSIGQGKASPVPSYLDFDLWQGPAPPRDFKDNYVHYNWHWFWHWGTGELGNNGVHALDVCRWGLGVDYPLRVTSAGGRYHWDDDQETPDTHQVTFQFPGKKMITWEGLSCARFGKRSPGFGVSFHGEKGSVQMLETGYVVFDKSDKEIKRVSGGSGGDAEHLSDFLAAIRNPRPTNANIEEGVKSTLLCLAGNIAQRTGRTINLDPKTHQITGDKEAAGMWGREYAKGWEPKF